MIRNLCFTICFVVASTFCLCQAIKVSPSFPTANGAVNLTFDISQAKDNRKNALLNQSDGLYIWAWGGSDVSTRKVEFSPTGQTSFDKPFAPGLLKKGTDNVWTITITPDQYYTIPASQKITWIGVLVKNADGTAQTEDFLVDLYQPTDLLVRFLSPEQENFFTEANQQLVVKANASQPSSLSIALDGKVIATAIDTTLAVSMNTGTGSGQKRVVVVTATANGKTATDQFSFTVSPEPKIAPLPAGLKNGINYTSATSATLVLFAPEKKFVYLLGEFNDWENQPGFLMNRTPDGQTYWLEIKNLIAKKEYPFQYLVDGIIPVGDPYAEKILDRNNDKVILAATYANLLPFPAKAQGDIVSVLQTDQVPYNWKVNNFKRPLAKDLVIYELLVRDFTAARSYQALSDTLSYLKRLGINAIELMPVMEFTGNDSWGYNPIFYHAPDKAYGKAADLKAFIDKCHENGIAVLLDMVLNQADYEFPYVKMYWDGTQPAKNSPMFNQKAMHPFSVFFDFNHESAATKSYVDRVTEFWMKEYHFDGYRFDLSKGFTQVNSGDNVAAWGAYDASRVAIWKRIYDQVRKTDSTAFVILEHFADDFEESELTDYGMLVWDNQNGAFRETIKSGKGNFNRLSWKSHTGFQKPAAIGYMESHDEERLMYDALTNGSIGNGYTVKSLPSALERTKASAALFMLTPGPKMIWQFGELGYDVSINENGRTGAKPAKWDYYSNPERLKLYKIFSELIHLKEALSKVSGGTFELDAAENTIKKLSLSNAAMQLHVLANLDVNDQKIPLPAGHWYDYFSGDEVVSGQSDPPLNFKPGEFHLLTNTKLSDPEKNLVPWKIQLITAIEPELAGNVVLSPVPAEMLLSVKLESLYKGDVTVSVFDMVGRERGMYQFVKRDLVFEKTISISSLQAGLYFLRIRQGAGMVVRRWVKK
ncbi:MAG: alpha-amylase family glycosyl hydrolase [Dyadobacter sp.]|uniref:alpha-amylase family glycosyl hydrolase n=1 Tax=Dyadobacter sp. TaxID=1914288 RepID=UPI003265CDE4